VNAPPSDVTHARCGGRGQVLSYRAVASIWKAALVGALAVSLVACGDDDAEPEWQVVHSDLDGALMSVWAASPDDVWAVGADPGGGPTVLRFDGESWTQEATGASGGLWWVFGFAGGPVYAGGEGGLILRYQGGSFEQMQTPGNGTVFGMWGASASDMWAVGGNLGGGNGAFAWRLDGDEWVEADGFPTELADANAIWKVFGRAANDVYFVGTNGTVLHHDGSQFEAEDAGTTRGLFTVHGTADRLTAVGGFGTGMLIERDGAGWHIATPDNASQLIGVFESDGDGYAVGVDGVVYRRKAGGNAWAQEQTRTGVIWPLHAVCIDSDGGVWAVGGQVLSAPFVSGVMIHKGMEIAGGLP